MDTLHTNRAALAEEEEEANTSAVLPQAGKAAVTGGSLATETLASGVPACSKTQVKESMSRSEAQATKPEGCLYCQLSSTQLLLRHGNAALQALSIAGQAGSNYKSHCLNWNWWEQGQDMDGDLRKACLPFLFSVHSLCKYFC